MVTQLDSTCRRGVVILLSSSAGQRRCPEAAGVKRNPMRPFEEFVEVARAQEPHCQYRQRRCYLDGTGIAADPAGAVYWFRSAIGRGNVEAMRDLGRCLLEGRGVEKNEEEGAKLLSAAAAAGDRTAILMLNRN